MTSDVATLLTELRRDHRNMAFCLDLLEQQSNSIYDDGDPDLELMHDVMTYMTVYPDAVHHPKEDRLYAELRAERPDLSSGFDRISVDHRRIAEDGIKLRAEIESAASGSPVHRKKVVADALRYVANLRSHMQWEELDLFRRCEALIDSGHKINVDEILITRRDPLFGAETEKRFNRLLESIRASQDAANG